MKNGIKAIRQKMGMTQVEFAQMLDMTQPNIGHYEARDQTVPPDVAKRLIQEAALRGFQITFEDIYAPEGA